MSKLQQLLHVLILSAAILACRDKKPSILHFRSWTSDSVIYSGPCVTDQQADSIVAHNKHLHPQK
jgi:hypothetical protein